MRSEAAINVAQRLPPRIQRRLSATLLPPREGVVNTASDLTSVVGGYWCNAHTAQQTGVSWTIVYQGQMTAERRNDSCYHNPVTLSLEVL